MLESFVSMHIPKTGGTVFNRQILQVLFPGQVTVQYGGDPLSNNNSRFKKGFKIVHGHFKASMYTHTNLPMITWISCPLDRMISHYTYSRKKSRWRVGGGTVRTADQKLIKFMSYIYKYRNFMTRFLDGVPMEKFAFIGVLEYWDESIRKFGEFIGADLSNFVGMEQYERNPSYYYRPTQKELSMFTLLNKEDLLLWEKCVKNYQ